MIDFEALECVSAKGASVGIGVDESAPNTFCLPIGYKTDGIDADRKKQYFFELYKLLKSYVKKNKLDEIGALENKNRGGMCPQNKGYGLQVKDSQEEVLLYTKINFLDSILDSFDPHAIQNVANRQAYSDEFQFEDALNHIDEAVFLKGGAFIVDEAIVSKKQVLIEPSEIALMFCFIYIDVKSQMGEVEEVSVVYCNLAQKFQELHLFPQASLFESDTFKQVKAILKERLELVDLYTSLKDDDYWKLRDAIYVFLYGNPIEEGGYWGIKKFWPIWEDLCFEAVSNSEIAENVFMADIERKGLFNSIDGSHNLVKEIERRKIVYKGKKDDYPFYFEQNANKKTIYPDLCLQFAYSNFNKKDYGDYYQILRPANNTNKFSPLLKSYLNFYKFFPQNLPNGHEIVYSSKIETERDNTLNSLNSLNNIGFMYVIDFKYKTKPDTHDKLKQYFYMGCLEYFSVSELWMPCAEGGECNSEVPDFKNLASNANEKVNLRYINIRELVKSYCEVSA